MPIKQRQIIQKIKYAIKDKTISVTDVAKQVGIPVSLIRFYARLARIELPKLKDKKLAIIRESINQGVISLEDICKATRLKPSTLWQYCKQNGIDMPKDIIPYRIWPDADLLIEEVKSLGYIGKKLGKTKECIRQYINGSGQYRLWREKRMKMLEERLDEREKRSQSITKLISILKGRVYQLASGKGFAYQKTAEFLNNSVGYNYVRVPFPKLVKLFDIYKKAAENNKKLSLKELSNKSGISYHTHRVLKRVVLDPMHGSNKRLSKEKIEAIKRSSKLDLSYGDIVYFLGVSQLSVYNHSNHKIQEKRGLRYCSGMTIPDQLTYRLASQVYEAYDTKFKANEIEELLATNKKVVSFALQNRRKLEPSIVKQLQELYGSKSIKTPYLV